MIDFSRNNAVGCPCMGCADRRPGCHGKCGRYAEWKKKIDARNEAERAYQESRWVKSDAAVRIIWRNTARKNSRKRGGDE